VKPLAHIAHSTIGRTRVRIPSKRGDEAYFGRIRDWLSALPGVGDVRINPRTASVLILHEASDPMMFRAELASGQVFELGDGEAPYEALLDRAAGELDRLDERLLGLTRGGLDVPGGLFTLFLVGAMVQAGRGQVLGPASSLLWYAYEILRHRGRSSA
jgi:hypothetical protein